MYIQPYTVQDTTPQATIPLNLQQVNAPSFWASTRGKGTLVAVIDTGLDTSHPEFAGRIFKASNFTNADYNDVTDIQGHGTHVAGIIAGKTCGVAPEARIWALKAFPDEEAKKPGTTTFINEAFRTILAHNRTCIPEDKVVAINCSFSGGTYNSYMAYMIRSLTEQGVTVCVAAGNAGDGKADTYEIYSYPAYIYECLTTGALETNGTSSIYTSSFDGIDIAAPGTNVYSAWPGGGYKLLSGTSMATPHITGAMALLYTAWKDREGVWPTEEEAIKVLMKHIREVNIDKRLVGNGVLDLSWDVRRWPLHRVQTGAFWEETNALKYQEELEARDIKTYKIFY
jgi:major intracellular serine protease